MGNLIKVKHDDEDLILETDAQFEDVIEAARRVIKQSPDSYDLSELMEEIESMGFYVSCYENIQEIKY